MKSFSERSFLEEVPLRLPSGSFKKVFLDLSFAKPAYVKQACVASGKSSKRDEIIH